MLDSVKALLGLAASILTISTIAFWLGHHAARIASLEAWRTNVRTDFHEVSDQMSHMSKQMATLTTLIEERTDRRLVARHEKEHRG